MPRRTREPFREVFATPRHSIATPRQTCTPRRNRPSYKLVRLGVVGQAIIPVLLFLRLILESVTLLFGLPIEDI